MTPSETAQNKSRSDYYRSQQNYDGEYQAADIVRIDYHPLSPKGRALFWARLFRRFIKAIGAELFPRKMTSDRWERWREAADRGANTEGREAHPSRSYSYAV